MRLWNFIIWNILKTLRNSGSIVRCHLKLPVKKTLRKQLKIKNFSTLQFLRESVKIESREVQC